MWPMKDSSSLRRNPATTTTVMSGEPASALMTVRALVMTVRSIAAHQSLRDRQGGRPRADEDRFPRLDDRRHRLADSILGLGLIGHALKHRWFAAAMAVVR